MPKNLVYIGIIVLAVIAVVLGYKIYKQQAISGQQSNATTIPQSILKQETSKTSQSPAANNKPQSTTQSQQPSAAETAQVLNFPTSNATDAEKKAHSDLVNQLGNQSGLPFLDISRCKPNPIVYRVKQGGSFKIKNSDQIDHVIYTTKRTTIKAGSDLTVFSSAIGDNLGDFGYNCDSSTSPVGIIQIIP